MTRMAPKPSKTTTAWWPASNLTDVPLFMKCQINDQLTPNRPTQTGSPWQSWSLHTTSQLHLLLHYTIIYSGSFSDPTSWWLSQSCDSFAAAAFAVEMLGPNGPNKKHSLKETIVAALPVQLQQWHPCEWQDYDQDGSQDKQDLSTSMAASVELDICAIGSWNVKSTIRKAELPQHKPGSPWRKLLAAYNFAASPFLHCTWSLF